MNLPSAKLLAILRKMTQAAQEIGLSARLTGENFNVFKILNLQTSEVRAHSAFIAELLNPNGSHGQEAMYLQLFLKYLDLDDPKKFEPSGAIVEIEHYIGKVDNNQMDGGRIDIMLRDKKEHRILIENKIYAKDIEKQLRRYHHFDKNARLIYLTLNGRKPTKESTGEHQELDEKLKLLSYSEDILKWLDDCRKASVSLPVVRETILQYECLIRELTNQATGGKMKEKAKELILASPDLVDSIVVLCQALQDIISDVTGNFNEKMDEAINSDDCLLQDSSTTAIGRRWGSDTDGLWIAFYAYNKSNKQTLEIDDTTKEYSGILKKLTSPPRNNQYNKTWNIGWFNPKPFDQYHNFESIPQSQILSFYKNDPKLIEFIEKIKEQSEKITKELLVGINSL